MFTDSSPERLETANQLVPQGPFRRGALHNIMVETAAKHGLPISDIQGLSRKAPIAAARNEFYYRAMNETDREVTVIAMACNRVTATVMSGGWRHAMLRGLPAPRGISRAHWVKFKRSIAC